MGIWNTHHVNNFAQAKVEKKLEVAMSEDKPMPSLEAIIQKVANAITESERVCNFTVERAAMILDAIDFAALRAELQAEKDDNKTLEEDLDDMGRKRDVLKAELQAAREEIERLNGRVADLWLGKFPLDPIATLSSQLATVQAELQAARDDNASLMDQILKADNLLDAANERLEKMHATCELYEGMNLKQSSRIAELEQECDRLKGKRIDQNLGD